MCRLIVGLWTVLMMTGLMPLAVSQDTGASLLSAARKRAAEARGTEGEVRVAIYEDVLKVLEKVPEQFPDEKASVAKAYLEMGRYARRLGRNEEALAAFENVLRFKEQAAVMCDALHDLAGLQKRQKDYEAAERSLLRIVVEYPKQERDRAQALLRLAGMAKAAKDSKLARERWTQVLRDHGSLWRQSVDALDRLVVHLVVTGDRVEAARVLETERAALQERFKGTAEEAKLERALDAMKCNARLKT